MITKQCTRRIVHLQIIPHLVLYRDLCPHFTRIIQCRLRTINEDSLLDDRIPQTEPRQPWEFRRAPGPEADRWLPTVASALLVATRPSAAPSTCVSLLVTWEAQRGGVTNRSPTMPAARQRLAWHPPHIWPNLDGRYVKFQSTVVPFGVMVAWEVWSSDTRMSWNLRPRHQSPHTKRSPMYMR